MPDPPFECGRTWLAKWVGLGSQALSTPHFRLQFELYARVVSLVLLVSHHSAAKPTKKGLIHEMP